MIKQIKNIYIKKKVQLYLHAEGSTHPAHLWADAILAAKRHDVTNH